MERDRFDLKRPGVFKTRLMENVRLPGEGSVPFALSYPERPPTVRVDQTPREATATRSANYPRYDLLDVQNIPNRKRV